MPTTTITPIPFNGGTLTLKSKADITYVHMGAGKFVMLYTQRNPNLLYAYVVNVTGLNTDTPVATNGPQFAFTTNNGNVRGWKMAANRIAVLMGNDLRVIDIDGSDNLTLRAGALTGFYNAAYLWQNAGATGVNNPETNDLGNMITAIATRDNEMQFFRRGNAQNNQLIQATGYFATKVVFNPTTDTLTMTAMPTMLTPPVGSTGYHRFHVRDVPNSTEKMIYVVGSDSANANWSRGNSSPRIQESYLINEDGLFVRSLDYRTGYIAYNGPYVGSGTYATHMIMPMGADGFIGFVDGCSYIRHSGSTAISARTSVTSTAHTGAWGSYNKFYNNGEHSMVNDAVMIDDSHAIIAMTAPVDPAVNGSNKTAREASTRTNYLRVIKFVDSNFVDVSNATKTYTSQELGAALCPDQPTMFHKVENNCYVFLSKSDTSEGNMQVTIKAIRAA